ncbi:hypothetical protein [Gorillibacterium sp. sgz500922]|uniref:hypothetical protein n=1 Tax=Gorillibacterium sp. sgz500922 TaxID=3446694 RepID=UPI003F67062C
MKKQWAAALIAVAVLSGCAGNADKEKGGSAAGQESSSPPVSASPSSGDPEPVRSDAPSPASPAAETSTAPIAAEKGPSSYEITLPASLFDEETTLENVSAKAKQDGISQVVKNKDGSYTYKMSKSVYGKMVKDTKQGILDFVAEVKSGKDFPSIKDVTPNKALTEFDVLVD